MKIVLWGYHEAGYRALRYLAAQGHDLFVVTQEAPPYVPSVTELAHALGVPLLVGPKREEMREEIARFGPDLGLSVYYPRILSDEVIALPRQGAYNFHPSLLPRHRGCFSAPWAILEGDRETGVTCHEMVAGVDEGRILCQAHLAVSPDETAFSLYYKLVDAAVGLIPEAVAKATREDVALWPQELGGCYHRRELPYGGVIDPAWPADKIDRFIRAMHFPPHEPAKAQVGGTDIAVSSYAEYVALGGRAG